MKVSLEGTSEEILVLAGLLGCNRVSLHSIGDSTSTDSATRDVRSVQTNDDDVPNRFREEGVQ